MANYGRLMQPGVFSAKLALDIDYTDEALLQSDVPTVKILL